MYSRYEQRRRCRPQSREGEAQRKPSCQSRSAEPGPKPHKQDPSFPWGGGLSSEEGHFSGSLFPGQLPPFLSGILPGLGSGDLMVLLVLLLLLWEGREDSRGTILTLLIFLLL